MVLPAVAAAVRAGAQVAGQTAKTGARVAGQGVKKGATVAGKAARKGVQKGATRGAKLAGKGVRQGAQRAATRAKPASRLNPAKVLRKQLRNRRGSDDRDDQAQKRRGPGAPRLPAGDKAVAASAPRRVAGGAKRAWERVRKVRKRLRQLRRPLPKTPMGKAARRVFRTLRRAVLLLLVFSLVAGLMAGDDDDQQQQAEQEAMMLALSAMCGTGNYGGQLAGPSPNGQPPAGGADAAPPANDGTPTIMGAAELTAQQVKAGWDRTRGRQPPRLGIPIYHLIDLYFAEGQAEGVRADYAFAQAVLETGNFGNGDTDIHNYAGIGNTSQRTWGIAFPDPRTGVRAHVQLLRKFAQGNDVQMAGPDVAPDAGARASTFGQLTDTWAGDDASYWRNIQTIHGELAGRGGPSSGGPPSPGGGAGTGDPAAATSTNPLCPGGGSTGGALCPVQGQVEFGNDFNSPRGDGSPFGGGAGPHGAIDMMAARGGPVIAHVDGTITQSQNRLGGNSYQLRAGDGTVWYGAHLDRFMPRNGQVTAGEVIGYVGNTGAPQAPTHLHLEMWPGGVRSNAQNPYNLLRELCSGDPGPGTGPVPGSRPVVLGNGRTVHVVDLRDPAGHTVTVNASIAPKIQAMFAAARRDGTTLSVSSSFRTAATQREIWRRHNCDNRADRCAGEVAPPGSSNHERGLALDFNDCASRSDPCNVWMQANGVRYGMHHDPGWETDLLHWSTNGH